jgi:hypothetical protein
MMTEIHQPTIEIEKGRLCFVESPCVEVTMAEYKDTGVSRYYLNPFDEALPELEKVKSNFLTLLSNYPPVPSDAYRRSGEVTRSAELAIIDSIVIPFPEFEEAAVALTLILREAYVSRNPLTAVDRQRRHALAAGGKDGLPFPRDWKSTAKGHGIVSISGMGKSTLVAVHNLHYPQLIYHQFAKGEQSRYRDDELRCYQLVYLVLRVPHDGTLKSLCLQFFRQIDEIFGTKYHRQAKALRNIAPMADLMHQVATAVSLGIVFIDEVQNLRSATGNNAEIILNLFAELIEKAGISVVVIATPAVQKVIKKNVRNARKLFSYGGTEIVPMAKGSDQLNDFFDALWDYTFVSNKGELTKSIRNAWYQACGGNTAFASLAFMLSQRYEIGKREVIDTASFARTLSKEMAFLQPAISALCSKKENRLAAFDDLLFDKRYRALRKNFGLKVSTAESDDDEFDELAEETGKDESAGSKKPPAREKKSGGDAGKRDPLAS